MSINHEFLLLGFLLESLIAFRIAQIFCHDDSIVNIH